MILEKTLTVNLGLSKKLHLLLPKRPLAAVGGGLQVDEEDQRRKEEDQKKQAGPWGPWRRGFQSERPWRPKIQRMSLLPVVLLDYLTSLLYSIRLGSCRWNILLAQPVACLKTKNPLLGKKMVHFTQTITKPIQKHSNTRPKTPR